MVSICRWFRFGVLLVDFVLTDCCLLARYHARDRSLCCLDDWMLWIVDLVDLADEWVADMVIGRVGVWVAGTMVGWVGDWVADTMVG